MPPSVPIEAPITSPAASIVADRRTREWRALVAVGFVLCASLFIMAITIAVSLSRGEGIIHAVESTPLDNLWELRLPGSMDSWAPMLSGYARAGNLQSSRVDASASAQGSPYQLALSLDRCKFQYPPSSWFILELLPKPAGLPLPCALHDDAKPPPAAAGAPASPAPLTLKTVPWPVRPWLGLASTLACLALAAVSVALLRQGLKAATDPTSRGAGEVGAPGWVIVLSTIAAFAAGMLFYPMLKGHALGQLQVFINLALGAALLLFRASPVASGMLIGLCGLIKPQYAPLVLWALLRRRFSFAMACACVLMVGHGLAVIRYGLDVHVQYVEWLSQISRLGEAFWANQSINGVLNRLLGTADPMRWVPDRFATYHPLVRWMTLATSLVLIVVALVPVRRTAESAVGSRAEGDISGQLDLASMLCAVTLASPIAWEHHYGSFLPSFALLLAAMATRRTWPLKSGLALAFAYLITANAILRPEWFFVSPARGLLAAHLLLGGLLTFALLLRWRQAAAAPRPAST